LAISIAAITCGIPLPLDAGAKRFDKNHPATNKTGVAMNNNHTCGRIWCIEKSSAQANNLAYNTAIKPVMIDAIQNGKACKKLFFRLLLVSLSIKTLKILR